MVIEVSIRRQSLIEVVMANLATLNSPLYEGLESNLPHMLMQYSDTPFPEGLNCLPHGRL